MWLRQEPSSCGKRRCHRPSVLAPEKLSHTVQKGYQAKRRHAAYSRNHIRALVLFCSL